MPDSIRTRGLSRIRVMRIIGRMNVGGPALQVTTLMRGLDPDRFEHRLYTGFVAAAEADYLEQRAPDVTVSRVATLGRAVRPADDVWALAELTLAMRRFRPHIVHTHTAKAGTLGRVAAVLAGVPTRVHTFHGHLLHGYFSPAKTRAVIAAERGLARVTDRLVAVGSQVRDDLVAAGIGRAGQYAVVPPGTALGPLPSKDDARHLLGIPPQVPVVAYVGRVTPIKRPDRFVALARQLRRHVPEAHFVVCGRGDAMTTVEDADDLAGAMHLLGWRPDVETVYAAADVVVLTSDNEGMPVSLVEAAHAGVPVVATRVGSVAEVVRDGQTGLLAACQADEIAAHVARLLGDEPLRRRMGGAARKHAALHFGPDRLVADIHELYTTIAVTHGWWPPTVL